MSIDFFASQGPPVFLKAGYAVLSFTYSSVASDNHSHTGSFYALYPYSVTAGKDSGVLLGWAWGASRCADAVEYLARNDPNYSKLLDPGKLDRQCATPAIGRTDAEFA